MKRVRILIFTDNTIIFFANGEVQHDNAGRFRVEEIEGQRGSVGFGPSPTCAFNHVMAEYQIILDAAGRNSYSPDPIFWGGTSPSCTVTITGGSAIMNVGERVEFTANVSGGGTPVTYQWTVDGAIIKDYSETTNAPWSTTPMQASDFRGQSISFYWKPPLAARQVSVNVTAGSDTCSTQRSINVERNSTDITKQAEDFYSSNHSQRILQEHLTWHRTFPFNTSSQGGELFFSFDHEYISRFNSWRAEFGYPAVGIWDPATPLPTGVDIDHSPRPGTTNPSYAKPAYFTIVGGAARPSNGLPCEAGAGQTKLANFPANRNLLGCAVESPWHNSVHVALSGDMAAVQTAPKDPIFWRWHNFVDTIAEDRKTLTPPTVQYQSPFRLFRFINALPTVSVTWSEPVSGVSAADLRVNGSPATSVSGSGAGPYLFSGFAAPALGLVTVEMAPGQIVDLNGEAFEGASWTYTLIDPAQDGDNDGLNDGDEVSIHLTDPTVADTDGDGLPDGFEIANRCLNPLQNEIHPQDIEGNPLLGDDDADDGLTDLEEFQRGTDPCRGGA